MTLPRLIGMVHLAALPGAPGFAGSLGSVVTAATRDATTLEGAGFDGLMVENFGDVPFFADDVPKVTVAAMTAVLTAVQDATGLPTGVNVLRNDGLAAVAIAAATGAPYIRVNVLSGTMYTDQGPIVGRAAEVVRARSRLCPDTAILADVFVKHAIPPPGSVLHDAVRDLVERAGADAIVVSGAGTGQAASADDVAAARSASTRPVYVGSGVTALTVGTVLRSADGVIVGSAVKVGGRPSNPVDLDLAMELVRAATT